MYGRTFTRSVSVYNMNLRSCTIYCILVQFIVILLIIAKFLFPAGTKLFVKPKVKSNRSVIHNAICYSCLAGSVNQQLKDAVLQVFIYFMYEINTDKYSI